MARLFCCRTNVFMRWDARLKSDKQYLSLEFDISFKQYSENV